MTTRWTREEIAIALYFSSRRVQYNVVSYLLLRRGFCRSSSAIQHKISKIIHVQKTLKLDEQKWNLDEVDSFLDNLMKDQNEVNDLIMFSVQDATDVLLVRSPSVKQAMKVLLLKSISSLLSTRISQLRTFSKVWKLQVFDCLQRIFLRSGKNL